MTLSIRGLQEAQKANLAVIRAARPTGALGRATLYMATGAHRYAASVSHVDTGAMKASHRIEQEGSARFRISLDPKATNPRTGQRTSIYGAYEHRRGGDHAFYELTYRQGHNLGRAAINQLLRELP